MINSIIAYKGAIITSSVGKGLPSLRFRIFVTSVEHLDKSLYPHLVIWPQILSMILFLWLVYLRQEITQSEVRFNAIFYEVRQGMGKGPITSIQ
jgi:hypothetical protein